MARLGGELCAGLRLHPIGTFAYTEAKTIPVIAKGAETSGRTLAEIDVVGAPFLAVGLDEEAVVKARQALKQHISFYASTRTYHTVLEHHGWEEVGLKLHQLSKEGKWTELPNQITDEMLDEWAITATFDDFADEVVRRCKGVFDTVLLDLPATLAKDDDRVKEIVARLHTA